MKNFILIILVLIIVFGGWFWYQKIDDDKNAIIIEPAPPVIYKDLIQVDFPNRDVAKITSPIKIAGKARGNWYFEASFPVEVRDGDSTLLGTGIAQAQGEWMTTEYVPFEGSITFTTPKSKSGTIIFRKDNPSGLPEHDDSVSIPVNF